MVIKGSARGGAASLAQHLQRTDTNERMEVCELRGVMAEDLDKALQEMEALASGARSARHFYHASINTRADEVMTPEQWQQAVDRLERELNLTDQPRAVVAHVKEGRAHIHIVWSRIDLETMTAIPDSHNYRRHELVARELERAFGHTHVQGAHIGREGERPARTPSHAEMQQAERTGIDPHQAKAQLTEIWNRTDSGRAFAAAIEEQRWILARGDRRDFVVVDEAGEAHSLARRIDGAKAKDIRTRMADVDAASLPSVDQAKEIQRQRPYAQTERAAPVPEIVLPAAPQPASREDGYDTVRPVAPAEQRQTDPFMDQVRRGAEAAAQRHAEKQVKEAALRAANAREAENQLRSGPQQRIEAKIRAVTDTPDDQGDVFLVAHPDRRGPLDRLAARLKWYGVPVSENETYYPEWASGWPSIIFNVKKIATEIRVLGTDLATKLLDLIIEVGTAWRAEQERHRQEPEQAAEERAQKAAEAIQKPVQDDQKAKENPPKVEELKTTVPALPAAVERVAPEPPPLPVQPVARPRPPAAPDDYPKIRILDPATTKPTRPASPLDRQVGGTSEPPPLPVQPIARPRPPALADNPVAARLTQIAEQLARAEQAEIRRKEEVRKSIQAPTPARSTHPGIIDGNNLPPARTFVKSPLAPSGPRAKEPVVQAVQSSTALYTVAEMVAETGLPLKEGQTHIRIDCTWRDNNGLHKRPKADLIREKVVAEQIPHTGNRDRTIIHLALADLAKLGRKRAVALIEDIKKARIDDRNRYIAEQREMDR